MSAKEGIKRHGSKVVQTLLKEFSHFHAKGKIDTTDPRKFACARKRKCLNAISVVKEKRHNIFKGRSCTSGKKKKEHKTKEESR